MVFFFFFSSRRRHTRCGRDWSSDVCSSDLAIGHVGLRVTDLGACVDHAEGVLGLRVAERTDRDRKSTRLNSSHVRISYAVFCLKKKNKTNLKTPPVTKQIKSKTKNSKTTST